MDAQSNCLRNIEVSRTDTEKEFASTGHRGMGPRQEGKPGRGGAGANKA